MLLGTEPDPVALQCNAIFEVTGAQRATALSC